MKKLGIFIRVVGTLALFVFLAYHIPVAQITADFAIMDTRWLLIALIAQMGSHIAAGLRWWWLIRQNNYPLALAPTIRYFFAANLLNQGLPSTMGGDSYRIWAMHRSKENASKTQSLTLVATDRLIGVSSLVLLGALSLLVIPSLRSLGEMLIGAWLLGGVVMASLCALTLHHPGAFWRALMARFSFVAKAAPVLNFGFHPRYFFSYQFLGVVIHLFSFSAFAFCCRAFSLDYPLAFVIIAISCATLLTMLPISISGWGVRESTLLSVFAYLGFTDTSIVSASLIYGFIMLLSTLPGAYALFFDRVKK